MVRFANISICCAINYQVDLSKPKIFFYETNIAKIID